MPKLLLLIVLSLAVGSVTAQQPYFQQDVSYDIDVRLDDVRHELHATLRLSYTNNSPDTLTEIPFHCWPRAYQSRETAFARQQLRSGSTRFHFADPADRGTLDSLAFTVDGTPAQHAFDPVNPDIAVLALPRPLLPGGSIAVRTPFRVRIPKSFSRMGRVGTSYQLTQWYPKPAVYDRAGWHPMPYLNLGEFYSEFGDFTVRITLPDNYLVGATGELQTAAEREHLLQRAATDRAALADRRASADGLPTGFVRQPFPESAATPKTLTYAATGVHDFAWFADKRFYVLHDTLRLSGQPEPVDVWSFFNETEAALWLKSTDYLKRSVRFYSRQVGNYPYPQVTAVQAALSVGAGMEYPMVTVIGNSGSAAALDEVLAHEVGHNWFYGILGSNERQHAWMDEGINSFYERRYMDRFWPDRPPFTVFGKEIDYDRLGYHTLARRGLDQAPSTDAARMTELNYWTMSYSKPAMALRELETFVGTAALDRAMRAYYDEWRFRHPQPDDFFAVLDRELGPELEQPLLPWFAEGFTTNYTSDWRGGPNRARHFGLRTAPASAPTVPPDATLDLYPANNRRGKSWSLDFLTAQQDPDKHQLFYAPLLGYNEHDGLMPGLALHNRTLEPRRFEFIVAPLYGVRSGRLAGLLGLRQRREPGISWVREIVNDYAFQRFSDFTLSSTDEAYDYLRLALNSTAHFPHRAETRQRSSFETRYTTLWLNRPEFAADGTLAGTRSVNRELVSFTYRHAWDRTLNPFAFSARLEAYGIDEEERSAFNRGHLRLDLTVTGGRQYEAGKWLRYRFFGGYFLLNELRESSVRAANAYALVGNAASDYAYEGLYVGRNLDGFSGRQIEQRQGGFRAPVDRAFGFGLSNSYMTALNVDADLPALPTALPLGVFLDAGYYGTKDFAADPLEGQFNWVGGVSLTVLDGQVGLYLPLVADPDTRDLLEQTGSLFDRLSFRLNLAGLMPWQLTETIR